LGFYCVISVVNIRQRLCQRLLEPLGPSGLCGSLDLLQV
jgi:hypothetical protein